MRRHTASVQPPSLTVRLHREHGLWAVWAVLEGQDMWLAGLLTEEARERYLAWHPEWEIQK
jgi:hypothetical protein